MAATDGVQEALGPVQDITLQLEKEARALLQMPEAKQEEGAGTAPKEETFEEPAIEPSRKEKEEGNDGYLPELREPLAGEDVWKYSLERMEKVFIGDLTVRRGRSKEKKSVVKK